MLTQPSIKSNDCSRRGTAPAHLLSGAKSRTQYDWKSFMSNDRNKTQLISLLLDQWKTDKYATRRVDRILSHVRVKSGIFGQTAKFGQPPCLFQVQLLE